MSFSVTYYAANKADAEQLLEQKSKWLPNPVFGFLQIAINNIPVDGPMYVSASGHLNEKANDYTVSSAVLEVRPLVLEKPVLDSNAEPVPAEKPVDETATKADPVEDPELKAMARPNTRAGAGKVAA